ncbi:hypothetical protein JQC92_00460 [Shewanella sp. 202IG2-18]|uniref:hypothetical protein n=1 Tax=Parashewanella hymeniacidonis TaxID=2807618 RepID=UPI00196208B6|nr:hypothetical protein [Parashewanella hymeniacidonis]MBM7070517.1 hypothetical protein [Parashewanella hymeniacidonis]
MIQYSVFFVENSVLLTMLSTKVAAVTPQFNGGEKLTSSRFKEILTDKKDCFELHSSRFPSVKRTMKKEALVALKTELSNYPIASCSDEALNLIHRYYKTLKSMPDETKHTFEIKLITKPNNEIEVKILLMGKHVVSRSTSNIIKAYESQKKYLLKLSDVHYTPTTHAELIAAAEELVTVSLPLKNELIRLMLIESFDSKPKKVAALLSELISFRDNSQLDSGFDSPEYFGDWRSRSFKYCRLECDQQLVIHASFLDDDFYINLGFGVKTVLPKSIEELSQSLSTKEALQDELDDLLRGDEFAYSTFEEFVEQIIYSKRSPLLICALQELLAEANLLTIEDPQTRAQIDKIFEGHTICGQPILDVLQYHLVPYTSALIPSDMATN